MEPQECPGCRELTKRLAESEARIQALEGMVRDLQDIIKNLTKSSPPPRAAQAQAPAPAKPPTGRKTGGQPGHPPHLKKLLPPDRVRYTFALIPEICKHCRAELPQEAGPNDPLPIRHQVVELPPLVAVVTEYQGHSRTCPCCGKITSEPIPATIRENAIGSRLTATLSYFAGCHGMSKRGVQETAESLFGVPIALGTISHLEREMSMALIPSYHQAKNAVTAASVKHLDETGWKQAGRKRWLWTAAAFNAVVFLIHAKRNITALKDLLGGQFDGILCSDRWRTYDDWPLQRRQLCWAHLKRNWEKMAERSGRTAKWSRRYFEIHRRVFELWHLFRGGGCSRRELDERMLPLCEELAAFLNQGSRRTDRRFARFCERILQVFPAYWLFVSEDGVEPTNNHAERVQRRAVLWRKKSFGCHSAEGCRFVERILTAVQTLRLQGKTSLEFLTETIKAHRSGRLAPVLVPVVR